MSKDNKRVGVITFEKHDGRTNIGSARIRAKWLAKYWEDCEIFQYGQKYDVVIYQKVYWPKHAKEFKGIKILDLCDPDFLHWGYQTIEMLAEVDAITTSSEALAEVFKNFTDKPVMCIPDRLDLAEHSGKKYHSGDAKSVVWFGYSTGYDMLKPVIHFIKKLDLDLICISDKPFLLPKAGDGIELINYPWNAKTVNHDILKGDIVINPQSLMGKWKFKSNNKTLTAWALGIPVAKDVEQLKEFMDGEARQKESNKRLQEIKDKWDIKISVKEFKKLIKQINGK